jgi:hypothetical protein
VCIYSSLGRRASRVVAQSVQRGGPLDSALNASYHTTPPGLACTAVARLPAVAVLTYASAVRYVALDMGGCPAVVLSTGNRRMLRPGAAATLLHYWRITIQRHR